MVWNPGRRSCRSFWGPFNSCAFTLLAMVARARRRRLVFGWLTFRRRISGVYFSILTQALAFVAWLMFNRNELNLGGTNGLTDFKTILGFTLNDARHEARALRGHGAAGLRRLSLCRALTRSPKRASCSAAIRDSETRRALLGLRRAAFKLFVFVLSAMLAGLGGALYVPQVGIITPSQMACCRRSKVVIWVAVGGRGTLLGPILGAVG